MSEDPRCAACRGVGWSEGDPCGPGCVRAPSPAGSVSEDRWADLRARLAASEPDLAAPCGTDEAAALLAERDALASALREMVEFCLSGDEPEGRDLAAESVALLEGEAP